MVGTAMLSAATSAGTAQGFGTLAAVQLNPMESPCVQAF
jgi:hypothetical protein